MNAKFIIHLLIAVFFLSIKSHGQLEVSYNLSTAAYTKYESDVLTINSGGFLYFLDNQSGAVTSEVAIWKDLNSNGNASNPLQISMDIGDVFETDIEVIQNETNQIGVALLSSPSATTSYADRTNNYAVQVNLDGTDGTNGAWEIVSNGGTTTSSTANNTTSAIRFRLRFELITTTTMNVTIERMASTDPSNNTIDATETDLITLNNTNINAFSIYSDTTINSITVFTIIKVNSIKYTYSENCVWEGDSGSNSNWSNAANWVAGEQPTSTSNIRILSSTNNTATITGSSSTEVINNLKIQNGAELIIDTGNSLTINGDLSNEGSLTGESGSSIRLIGTSSGDGTLSYTRTLDSSRWYLMSAPVTGETLGDVYTNNNLRTGSTLEGQTSPNVGLGRYNGINSEWVYYTQNQLQPGGDEVNTELNFSYAVRLSDGATDFTVIGGFPDSDVSSSSLINGFIGDRFSLIGNPFPSYLDSKLMLESLSATTGTSSGVVGLIDTQTIWVWNGSAYVTYVAAEQLQLAPGQAFFVRAKSGASFADTFTYLESWTSHQSTDTFARNSNNSFSKIELSIQNDTQDLAVPAKIFYTDDASLGLDDGYDGPMFTGVDTDSSLAVYTFLADNSSEEPFAVQSVPEDYENIIIPIGLNASSGSEITISASLIDFPENVNVYLEDRENNTFTKLNEAGSSYTFTTNDEIQGGSRFFIHTTSSTLGIDDSVEEDHLSIFYYGKNLVIKSKKILNGTLEIFDIAGKQVFKSYVSELEKYESSLSSFEQGIYIVKFIENERRKTVKVLVE